MAERDGGQPDETMRGRVPGSRLRLWLLLEADRWVVAAVPLLLLSGSLVALGAIDAIPLRGGVQSASRVQALFQSFVVSILTGVTIVVTINQLVLSQELGGVGDQRERLEQSMAFRRDVEAVLDSPASPPEPSAFLRALIEVTSARSDGLRESLSSGTDDALRRRVVDFADSLAEHADRVSERIEDAQFGTFDVLSAALNFNYSWKIYEARRLRQEFADDLPEDTETAFDDVITVLELFGAAREHVKTLYFQWELVNLSRAVLYAAVPALAVAAGTVLFLDDPTTIPGTTAGVNNAVWIVSAAAAIALAPFMILLSYILRIATVAKRTLAIGPFILRESGRDGDIEWE